MEALARFGEIAVLIDRRWFVCHAGRAARGSRLMFATAAMASPGTDLFAVSHTIGLNLVYVKKTVELVPAWLLSCWLGLPDGATDRCVRRALLDLARVAAWRKRA